MNDFDVADVLGLDSERIAASAAAAEDYAAQSSDRGISPDEVKSAYTAAGSLWSLVDPARARRVFDRGAAAAAAAGSPDAMILGICATPRLPAPPPRWDERPLTDHLRPEALWLGTIWGVAAGTTPPSEFGTTLDAMSTRTSGRAALPVGRLRIPLALYLDLGWRIFDLRFRASPAAETPEHGADDAANALALLVSRAGEATAAARANVHQWSRLRPGILPVDPEAVAASMLAAMSFRDATGRAVSDELAAQLRPEALVPVQVAERLLDASEGES